MGETSICLYQGASKGAIIARKRKATDEAVDDEAVDGEAMAAEPEQKVLGGVWGGVAGATGVRTLIHFCEDLGNAPQPSIAGPL